MSRLTSREVYLINTDLANFEEYLLNLGNGELISRYKDIRIQVVPEKSLKRANGEVRVIDGKTNILLDESIISNNAERPAYLFHEIGHVLLGLKRYSSIEYEILFKPISKVIVDHRKKFNDDVDIYIYGFKCLEEYLVEKFSQLMCLRAKNLSIPDKRLRKHPSISGNYIFHSSFNSNYCIFESICDSLIIKTFGTVENAINSAYSKEYFSEFLKRYDLFDIMPVLENLGKVYCSIIDYANYRTSNYTPDEICSILESTNEMVNNLIPKRIYGSR